MVFEWLLKYMQNNHGGEVYPEENRTTWPSRASSESPPLRIMCDFELALRNSLRDTLGSVYKIQIHGCYFHWVQCLIRKANGLVADLMKNCFRFQLFVRHMKALAFLPVHQVIPTWNKLLNIFRPQLEADPQCTLLMTGVNAFIDYFENFWCATPSMCATWNQTNNMECRTNNDLE